MLYNISQLWLIALFLATLLTNAGVANGETLTIHRNSDNKVWIESTSSPEIGFRLQTSADFQTWTDVSDQASGSFSYVITQANETTRFFRLRGWNITDLPIKLALVGDSTVADLAANHNLFCGWGEGIHGYLKPNVQVVNLAIGNQSTITFLTSEQKESLIKIKPEFVLIAFGRIDFLGTPIRDYDENLRKIVQIVRGFNGTPILVTPSIERVFGPNRTVVPIMEEQWKTVRNVALDTRTYLIDLYDMSRNLYNELGPWDSAYISAPGDTVHFSREGANVIAGLVVKAFPAILQSQVKK